MNSNLEKSFEHLLQTLDETLKILDYMADKMRKNIEEMEQERLDKEQENGNRNASTCSCKKGKN